MGGASNLSHDANDLRNSVCNFCVLLDNDKAGKQAFEKARSLGIVKDDGIKYTICNGSTESEFEDCLKADLYKNAIMEEFNVTIDCKEFRGKGKWSDRLKNAFLAQGSRWDDSIEKKVKKCVADEVAKSNNIEEILIKQKAGFIDGVEMMVLKSMGELSAVR